MEDKEKDTGYKLSYPDDLKELSEGLDFLKEEDRLPALKAVLASIVYS